MTAPAKFLFDLDFAEGAEKKPSERAIAAAEHAAQLAEAEAAAYRRGVAAAEAQAAAGIQRQIAITLDRIGQALETLTRGMGGLESKLEAEAVDIAVQVGRKLAPELIAREPLAEVEALANDCFRQLIGAPHVVVRVNDAVYDTAREKLEAIARTRGFEGRLIVLGEPEIAPGDCRIEWADGGITRDRTATEAAIGEAVKRYVTARRTTGPDSLWRFDR